jgi:hypothetical protein
MSEEIKKPNVFVPIDWSKGRKTVTLKSVVDKFLGGQSVITEDIPHEVVQPKQISNEPT